MCQRASDRGKRSCQRLIQTEKKSSTAAQIQPAASVLPNAAKGFGSTAADKRTMPSKKHESFEATPQSGLTVPESASAGRRHSTGNVATASIIERLNANANSNARDPAAPGSSPAPAQGEQDERRPSWGTATGPHGRGAARGRASTAAQALRGFKAVTLGRGRGSGPSQINKRRSNPNLIDETSLAPQSFNPAGFQSATVFKRFPSESLLQIGGHKTRPPGFPNEDLHFSWQGREGKDANEGDL